MQAAVELLAELEVPSYVAAAARDWCAELAAEGSTSSGGR
jgi:hypothetical protein